MRISSFSAEDRIATCVRNAMDLMVAFRDGDGEGDGASVLSLPSSHTHTLSEVENADEELERRGPHRDLRPGLDV